MGYWVGSNVRWIHERPWLLKLLIPLARAHRNLQGYHKLGLKGNDLINEEDPIVLQALARLPEKEQNDRAFRLRRAFQLQINHKILPRDQWTPWSEDEHYLTPLVDQVWAEEKEKKNLEAMKLQKKH